MNRNLLLSLADRCESEAPSWKLSEAIAVALGWESIAGYSCRWIAPDKIMQCGFGPPDFTRNLDAAMSINPNWIIITISDIAADGLSFVKLGDPSTRPTCEVIGLGTGPRANLAIVFTAAVLRALAADL